MWLDQGQTAFWEGPQSAPGPGHTPDLTAWGFEHLNTPGCSPQQVLGPDRYPSVTTGMAPRVSAGESQAASGVWLTEEEGLPSGPARGRLVPAHRVPLLPSQNGHLGQQRPLSSRGLPTLVHRAGIRDSQLASGPFPICLPQPPSSAKGGLSITSEQFIGGGGGVELSVEEAPPSLAGAASSGPALWCTGQPARHSSP